MMKTIAKHLLDFPTITSFQFERDYYYPPYTKFAADNYQLAFGICIGYLAFCYFGKLIMSSRKRFDLRLPLAGWNAFLCIFSLCGMIRTVRLYLII